jgi:hypothetical protein
MAVSISYKQAPIRRAERPAKSREFADEAHLEEGKYRGGTLHGSNVGGHICCVAQSGNARKLRYLRVLPDAGVREADCASPRTENRERRFAPHPVVVYGGALGVAAAQATADGSAGRAVDNHACATRVALPLLARSCRGSSKGGTGNFARVGSKSTQLGRCLAPTNDNLDAVDHAALIAIGQAIPRTAALRRRPGAGQRDGRQPGRRDDGGLAAREAIRAVDRVHRREPRRCRLPSPTANDPRPRATGLATGKR